MPLASDRNLEYQSLVQYLPMPAMILTPPQEAWIQGLVEAGVYQNKSEAIRAGVDALRQRMKPEDRMAAAIEAYRDGNCSVSAAAMMAGVPHRDMYDALRHEGILRLGFADAADSKKAASRESRAIKGKAKVAWKAE